MDNKNFNKEYNAGYKNLNTYKKADELVIAVYKVTKNFPKEELFGLISQIRRCAVSVVANVVEGYGRRTSKDKTQFYFIARGSLNELEYYIDLTHKLNYITSTDYQELSQKRDDVGRLLSGLIKSFNK